MKKIIAVSIILSIAMLGSAFAEKISRVFPQKAELEVECVLGSCEFRKSPDNRIHVTVEHNYDADYFTPVFEEEDDKLTIEEDLHENGHDFDNQHSNWLIQVPDGMEIEFNTATGKLSIEDISAEFEGSCATGSITIIHAKGEFNVNSGTGNIEVEDCEGEFELNSGTGDVLINNSKGEFDANSGTGDVEAKDLKIVDTGDFNSGTGDVELAGFSGEKFELELNSGTGDAELDMTGKKVAGYYTMSTMKYGAEIESDFKFDSVEDYNNGGEDRVRKSFTLGKSDNIIKISSGTGNAILQK